MNPGTHSFLRSKHTETRLLSFGCSLKYSFSFMASRFSLKLQFRSWPLLSKALKQAPAVFWDSISFYKLSICVSTLLNRNEFKYSAELGSHLSAKSPVQLNKFTKLYVERITPDPYSMLYGNDPCRNIEPLNQVSHIIKSMTYTFAPDILTKAVNQNS